MRHYLILIVVLFWTSKSFATTIREDVLALVPAELATLEFSKKKSEIEKQFKSQIIKSDDKSFFLKLKSELPNATIGIKNEQVDYIYYKFAPQTDNNIFEKVYNQLTNDEKAKFETRKADRHEHEAGRELVLDLPDESLKIYFNNNSKRTINAVIIWKNKGEQI